MDAEILNYRKEEVMVTAYVVTYNHVPYIRQTIEAVLNQKRNFSLQILIFDDASTDGTSEVIREYAYKYPEIVTAIIQKENTWRKGVNVIRQRMQYVNGRYFAICDGDDYWPTQDKLQKQFDYLQTHTEAAAVGGITRYFDDEGTECMDAMPSNDICNKLISKQKYNRNAINVGMGTMMMKSEIVKDENYLRARDISHKIADSIIIANMFEYGNLYIMDEWFQYHRIQTRKDASNYNSITNTRQQFEDRISVLNARVTCLRNQNMRIWYMRTAGTFFWIFLKEHDLKSFFDVTKKVVSSYRKYTLLAIAYTFFVFVPQNAIIHFRKMIR